MKLSRAKRISQTNLFDFNPIGEPASRLSPIYSASLANYVFLLTGAIPVVVIYSCYASVYFELRKHNRNIQAQLPHGQPNKSRRNDFKAAKTTFIVYASSSVILIVPTIIALCIKIIFINTFAAKISKTCFYFSRQTWC